MTWLPPLDEDLRDAYLRRLGLPASPPSVESLFALHHAQVEHIPYESIWIWPGERRTVAPLDSVGHVARGRGGYCYHLNGPAHVAGRHGLHGPRTPRHQRSKPGTRSSSPRRSPVSCGVLTAFRRDGDGDTTTDLTTSTDWFAALADVFDLPLSDVDPAGRRALWTKVDAAHEAWLAAAQ